MEVGRLVAGHEQVVFCADPSVGLQAVIAIHSTALGPALGGIRFWDYGTEREQLVDVLRLSEAMTLKASIAGLDQGGGKTAVMVEDAADVDAPRSKEFLHALGRYIDELGGRYIAAEDVGATQADMDGIAEVTPWVTGVDPARGGSGDPSPLTALGVLHGMRAAAERVWGEASLAGRRVMVQGVGHVGEHLVAGLVAEGADVVICDIAGDRVWRLHEEYGVATRPDAGSVEEEPCDILAPCALGGLLTVESVARLRCRVVCGAANNQLGDSSADAAMTERGILYAPDFVVNAGGIINIAQEWAPGGYSADRAMEVTGRIRDTTARVLEEAARHGEPTGHAAERLAWERIRREGRGRWEAGDPAAWTNGKPLTHLRG